MQSYYGMKGVHIYDSSHKRYQLAKVVYDLNTNEFLLELPQDATHYDHQKISTTDFQDYLMSLPKGNYPLYVCLEQDQIETLISSLYNTSYKISIADNPIIEIDCLSQGEIDSMTDIKFEMLRLSSFIDSEEIHEQYTDFITKYPEYDRSDSTFITLYRMYSLFYYIFSTFLEMNFNNIAETIYSVTTKTKTEFFDMDIYLLPNNLIFSPMYLAEITSDGLGVNPSYYFILTNRGNYGNFFSRMNENFQSCDLKQGGWGAFQLVTVTFLYGRSDMYLEIATSARLAIEILIDDVNSNVKRQ